MSDTFDHYIGVSPIEAVTVRIKRITSRFEGEADRFKIIDVFENVGKDRDYRDLIGDEFENLHLLRTQIRYRLRAKAMLDVECIQDGCRSVLATIRRIPRDAGDDRPGYKAFVLLGLERFIRGMPDMSDLIGQSFEKPQELRDAVKSRIATLRNSGIRSQIIIRPHILRQWDEMLQAFVAQLCVRQVMGGLTVNAELGELETATVRMRDDRLVLRLVGESLGAAGLGAPELIVEKSDWRWKYWKFGHCLPRPGSLASKEQGVIERYEAELLSSPYVPRHGFEAPAADDGVSLEGDECAGDPDAGLQTQRDEALSA